MVKISLLTASVVLASSMASAESHLIAECRGSVLKDMSMSEPYTISEVGNGILEVKGWYKDSRGLVLQMNAETVKVNNGKTLFVQEKRKRLGFTVESKTVELNFEKGTGNVSHYRAIDQLTKARKSYLVDCRR